MKCIEAIHAMSDSIEQALAGEALLAFDCHMAACRSCSLYLAQIRLTIELTGCLREESKPAADFHRVLLHRANA